MLISPRPVLILGPKDVFTIILGAMLILDVIMLVLGVLCALFVLIYNIFKHHVSFPIPFEGLLSSVKQTMECNVGY